MTPSSRKCPRWSHDETLLALHAARFSISGRIDEDHPAIVTLSRQLRSIAPAYAAQNHRYRNPHGAARKVWHFVSRLGGNPDRASSPVEEAVWQEFQRDPRGLRKAALEIALAIEVDTALPSRGPPPSIGTGIFSMRDRVAWLYLALLDHPSNAAGPAFLKIGHSVDIGRRTRELNFGFPPPWGAGWRMLGRWLLPSRMQAYACEQSVLQAAAQAGISAGREFLSVSPDRVESWIDRCAEIADRARNDRECELALSIGQDDSDAEKARDNPTRVEGTARRRRRSKRRTRQAGGSPRQMIKRPQRSRRVDDPGRLVPAKGEKP